IQTGIEHLDEAAERSGESGLLFWRDAQRSRLAQVAGDLETAEALAARPLEHSEEPTYRSLYGVRLLSIRYHQGRLGELAHAIERFADRNPTVTGFQVATAWTLAHTGQLERAQARLAELRSHLRVPWDRDWLNTMRMLAETAALVGDVEAADHYFRQLLPWAHLHATAAITFEGPVAHTLGLLAEALDRPDEAAAHYDAALEMSRQLDAPFHTASAQLALGRLRGDRGRIDEALDLAERHGFAALAAGATDARRTEERRVGKQCRSSVTHTAQH